MNQNQGHFSQRNLFTTASSINRVYIERDDEKRKIIFYVPAYIYINVYNASQIKIQERNIALHANIKLKLSTQGISEYLSSQQILDLLGIQEQDLSRIDLQKLYSAKYYAQNRRRQRIVIKFGLNPSMTPELAPSAISDTLSLKKVLTLEIDQKIIFTAQQSFDWRYRYLYIFTPTYFLNLQESMMVQNLVIPINFTNSMKEQPYIIQYSFNFMETMRQSSKFNIQPKLLEKFGQYQVANNLISIHFSNLKYNKQYLNQRKVTKLENQYGKQQQKYLSDYDQFSSEFLDLEENVRHIRQKITGYIEHENDGLIQNLDFKEAKDKWRILYQKHHMKTKQALRYACISAKSRQQKQVTFRNWKFAHFQIPIYKNPEINLFQILIPLTTLAIAEFFIYWISRSQEFREKLTQNFIRAALFISGALVSMVRISKPSIIRIGFYQILIFASMITSVLLLLYIGVENTDQELGKSFEQAETVRSIYMIVAFTIQCLIVIFLLFSTIFYCFLRRRISLRSKEVREDRTCCLDYHFLRVQRNLNTHGKMFNLRKWYNNQCCRNFVLYGKRKIRDWHTQYINRQNLNIQNKKLRKKEFICLPLHKGLKITKNQ